MKTMLEKKIRRYKMMEKHQELVCSGKFEAARLVLELLRTGRVHLGLDDDSWIVERECEEMGCYIYYGRSGYSAIVHL